MPLERFKRRAWLNLCKDAALTGMVNENLLSCVLLIVFPCKINGENINICPKFIFINNTVHANNIKRYASHNLANIYRETDCQFADMGLLWLQHEIQASNDAIDDYVQQVFVHLWQDEGKIDLPQDIEPLYLATRLIQNEFSKSIQDGTFINAITIFLSKRSI